MSSSLVDKLNFELAAKQVIIDFSTDSIIDKLGVEILKEFKTEIIEHLKEKIIASESKKIEPEIVDFLRDKIINSDSEIVEAEIIDYLEEKIINSDYTKIEYEPLPLERIDIPKKNFTFRHGSVPEIVDRIYYQALCNAIASKVDSSLTRIEDNVLFSYRLSDKEDDENMFIKSSKSYNDFISYQNFLCESNDYQYVLETDIADYFERIYHHNLIQLLQGFSCDYEIIEAIAKLLRKWNEGVSYGIPQSLWPSYLLGNSYLHELDVAMIRDGIKYVRYVDDIRVFCKSKEIAKRELMRIDQIIRPLGLNLQPSKTIIYEKKAFCERIRPFSEKLEDLKKQYDKIEINFDPYFNEFNLIKLPEQEIEIKGLNDLFNSAKSSPINEQEIKFCLSGFSYTRQLDAIPFCLQNLSDLPHLSSYFINYMTSLEYDPVIAKEILNFLESENNIYSWQEMWLLRYFHLIPKLNNDCRTLLRNIFSDGGKHIACRSIAALILGKSGNLSDLKLLKNNFNIDKSLMLKKAIIFAIKDLPSSERNHKYKYWNKQHWCLKLAINYTINYQKK